jgi:hypothetical protein
MRWVAVVGVAIVAGAGAFFVYVETTDHLFGVRLESVDKDAYVDANEAVLRTIPVYRELPLVASYSTGITAQDAFFAENGPPYDRYYTWHIYKMPPSTSPNASCDQTTVYYDGWFRQNGWTLSLSTRFERTFYNGDGALAYYNCVSNATDPYHRAPTFSLSVDHAARQR